MNPAKWFSKKVGGEYELGKTLGKGHFSKVKLGIHVRTKKQVAIKIMGVPGGKWVRFFLPPRANPPQKNTKLFSNRY